MKIKYFICIPEVFNDSQYFTNLHCHKDKVEKEHKKYNTKEENVKMKGKSYDLFLLIASLQMTFFFIGPWSILMFHLHKFGIFPHFSMFDVIFIYNSYV